MLLTPFRTQNIPPPMSSHQLVATSPDHPGSSVPIHASFLDKHDVLAVLFENGLIRVWDLHTRVGPGKGKVLNPELLREDQIEMSTVPTSQRQVIFLHRTEEPATDKLVNWTMAVLGRREDGEDVAFAYGTEYVMPKQNGRLVVGSPHGSLWWQSASGRLEDGRDVLSLLNSVN
jgi:elongator complex protein 1